MGSLDCSLREVSSTLGGNKKYQEMVVSSLLGAVR